MKNVVVSIYIHKEKYNCYSSKDFNGFTEFSSDEEVDLFISNNGFEIADIQKEDSLNLTYYILKGYSNNYRREECESLFKISRPSIINEFLDLKEKRKNLLREKVGYVYCKKNDDMTLEDYKGSLNLLLTDKLLSYIEYNPSGYLGHPARKHNFDKIIEEELANCCVECDVVDDIDIYKCVAEWLCSSSSRHWLDNHEDDTDEEFRMAVIESIKDIVISGFSYHYDYEYSTAIKIVNVLRTIDVA